MKYIKNPTPEGTTFRLIICAGPGFSDWDYFQYAADKLLELKAAGTKRIEIVYGACIQFEDSFKPLPNVDQLALRYAEVRGYIGTPVTADVRQYGDAAFHLRYDAMRDYAHAVLAFWDRKDKTIRQMIKLSEKEGLSVRVAHWYYHEAKKPVHA